MADSIRLSELCEAIVDCPHSTPMWTDSGPVVLRSHNIRSGRLDLSESSHTDEEHFAERTRRATPRAGDLVITREAPMGEVCMIPADLRCCLGQRMVLLRPDRAKSEPRYLLYALQSKSVQDEIGVNEGTGSTVSNLRIPLLEALPIPKRPLSEQRAVAHILGTLDDKIELNRRMNETLEEMARALFKSWFVDFDPVRAKTEGRDTGLPKPLADRFPDSFEGSELGAIPKGWRVAPLADCVDVVRGLSYKGSGLSQDGVPMHNLNSIYEGGGYKYDGLKYYKGEYKPHHVVRSADVIVANTEQGHHRLLIGYAAIVPSHFGGETLFSHHIYRVRPKISSGFTPDYLCHLLNTSTMHDTVSGYANGTTVNMLPIDGLQSPKVLVPHSRIVAAFNDIAEAARMRHEEMVEESGTLVALRDTLLPKLISGELRPLRKANR